MPREIVFVDDLPRNALGKVQHFRLQARCASAPDEDCALMRIAVLGGGNGSFAAAGDFALAGHEIRLWRRDRDAVAAHRAAGGKIIVKDFRGRHEAAPALRHRPISPKRCAAPS